MTLDEFKSQYPDIAVDDSVIQRYLDLFMCQYTDYYGCMADYLQGLFVAHRSYVYGLPSSPLVINTSKRVGDVSVSGQVVGGASLFGDFDASRYGKEFISLMSQFGAGPMMAGEYYGS